MKWFAKSTSLVILLVALSGCAAISSAPAGPLVVGGPTVTLGRQWSDISALMSPRPKNVRLLSIDGPLLNRLYLTAGLAPGQPLVAAKSKSAPTAAFRAGMSRTEQMEFVVDSVTAMEFLRVEAVKPRPATYAGERALRFDLTAATKDGLDIDGTALVAEIGGKLYAIVYLAPHEHYFAATLPEVESIMASVRLKS